MPISAANQWIPYNFSNCALRVINGNTTYVNVTLQHLNTSGLWCSIATNFPFFPLLVTGVVFVVLLFLFSYLQTGKLVMLAALGTWLVATLLLGFGLLNATIWMWWTVLAVLSIGYQVFAGR